MLPASVGVSLLAWRTEQIAETIFLTREGFGEKETPCALTVRTTPCTTCEAADDCFLLAFIRNPMAKFMPSKEVKPLVAERRGSMAPST